MTVYATARQGVSGGLTPLSLANVPAFIERQFPVGRLSAEAYKERKAGAGQTLTALGSYWKGRKPLILVRAVVLGALLPATDDPAADLDIFLKLMAMDDDAFLVRLPLRAGEVARLAIESGALDPADLPKHFRLSTAFENRVVSSLPPDLVWSTALEQGALVFDTGEAEEREMRLAALSTFPYGDRVKRASRPEELDERPLLAPIWGAVNAHLGTTAQTIPELVEQLGIARFGHRPKVADTFCGGGSIPFESARIGCDVYASDLNPIACMLTWGAFNIIGASPERRAEIEAAQRRVAAEVDAEITRLGVEHDEHGNRAKAYLYCLETRCPKTGWMVPMAPSWVIATNSRTVAKLVPDHGAKRYEIEIHSSVSSVEMAEAAKGTVQGGRLVHRLCCTNRLIAGRPLSPDRLIPRPL